MLRAELEERRKISEAVLSVFPNSLSVKSHSLWDAFISGPYGKPGFLGLLAQACCIHISSKGKCSSSGMRLLPILPGDPGQLCHAIASVRGKMEVV